MAEKSAPTTKPAVVHHQMDLASASLVASATTAKTAVMITATMVMVRYCRFM